MPEPASTRLGLVAPSSNDPAKDGDNRIRAIVAQLEALAPVYGQGTLAGRPAAGVPGRLYRASDVGAKGTVYWDSGAAWSPLNGVPPLVSALPGGASDGDVVHLLVDPAGGAGSANGGPMIWPVRFRQASPATHKWEIIGSAPALRVDAAGSTSLGATIGGIGDLLIDGEPLQLQAPFAGVYEATLAYSEVSRSTGLPSQEAYSSLATAATPASDSWLHHGYTVEALVQGGPAERTRLVVATAGEPVKARQRLVLASATFNLTSPSIALRPIRLSG